MKNRKNQQGFVLITLAGAAIMVIIFLNAFIQLYRFRAGQLANRWSQFAAQEVARSGINVLEVALQRRMWEVPPDENCLRSVAFGVEGSTGDDGIVFEVAATFDPATKIVQFVATGDYFGRGAAVQKNLRVMDASDFLVFSKSDQPSTFVAGGYGGQDNQNIVSGLIARNRRLYFHGPLVFDGHMPRYDWRNTTITGLSDFPAFLPQDHILQILQGERIYALAGMKNAAGNKPPMNPIPAAVGFPDPPYYVNTSYPFLGSFLTGWRYYQNSPHVLLTGDFLKAKEIVRAVNANDSVNASIIGLAEIKAGMYPQALAGGGASVPFNAATLTDDGNFEGNPDRWYPMGYNQGAGFWGVAGLSCYTTNAASKECANSLHFPRGFDAWRTAANLDEVLITGADAKTHLDTVTWDNMEALEEEAQECGLVVSSASGNDGVHEDCDVADFAMLHRWRSGLTGSNPCEPVVDLDLDSLGTKFGADWDPNAYVNKDERRIMRRVVYMKERTQVSQDQASGIFPAFDVAGHPEVRPNVPIWLVAEREILIKPFQPDMSSPLTDVVTPTVRRIGYFNHDPSGTLSPLSMVIMSPESPTMLSPTHNNMEFAGPDGMANMLNLGAGAQFRPRRTVITDQAHQETDYYTHGIRNITMSNIALVTNTNSGGYGAGFNMRGLWGHPDGTIDWIYQACWMDLPGDGLGTDASFAYGRPPLPWSNWGAYPDKRVPEPTSKFYAPPDGTYAYVHGNPWNAPHIWLVQGQPNAPLITFNGLRIIVDFSGDTPTGKRPMNVQYYERDIRNTGHWTLMFDFSDRHYDYSTVGMFAAKDDQQCGSAWYYGTSGAPAFVNIPFYSGTLWGLSFLQNSPDFTFNNLGALAHVELPSTHLRIVRESEEE